MKIYICSLLLVLCSFRIYALNDLQLVVLDKCSRVIPYSSVVINHHVQILGDKTGKMDLDKNKLHMNDSIVVSFLGYKPYVLVVDEHLMRESTKRITLEEQVYNLDAVQVDVQFDAVKFLKKKMKRHLEPYNKRRHLQLSAYCRRRVGDSITVKKDDHMVLNYTHVLDDSLLISEHIKEPVVKAAIIETLYKSSCFPERFCNPKIIKYFKVKYMGKQEDQYVFSCAQKPKYYKKKYFSGSSPDDQFNIVFKVNQDGYVTYAKYHLISTQDRSKCYQLEVMYKPYKNMILPYNCSVVFYSTGSILKLTTHEKL